MGMGSGAADLPFDHPCLKSTKYPARISIAVTYYGGEMAELLKMQGDAADEQMLQNATDEFKEFGNPIKAETLAGGRGDRFPGLINDMQPPTPVRFF